MGYFKNRKCKNCGIEYEPNCPTQKYCVECGNKIRREQQKKATAKYISKIKKSK
jgi:methionyl-tRNA synthetase